MLRNLASRSAMVAEAVCSGLRRNAEYGGSRRLREGASQRGRILNAMQSGTCFKSRSPSPAQLRGSPYSVFRRRQEEKCRSFRHTGMRDHAIIPAMTRCAMSASYGQPETRPGRGRRELCTAVTTPSRKTADSNGLCAPLQPPCPSRTTSRPEEHLRT